MCGLPRQEPPGRPHPSDPARPGRSASADRGRPASLIAAPAAAFPAPAFQVLASPVAAFQVLASPAAAFQVPYPCVSPPLDAPTLFPPCHHHGLRVSPAPGIRDTATALLPALLLLRADPSLSSHKSAKSIPPVPTEGGRRMRPWNTRGWLDGDGHCAGEGLPGSTRYLGEAPTDRRETPLSGGGGGRVS